MPELTTKRLVAIGAGVLVLAFIARFPADLAAHWLAPQGSSAFGVSGSVWRGQAALVTVGNLKFTEVTWRWRPGAMLAGRLGYRIGGRSKGGFLEGNVATRLSDQVWLSDVRGVMPLAAFDALVPTLGTVAEVGVRLDSARLLAAFPVHATGTLTIGGITQPLLGNDDLGNYRITLSDGEPDGIDVRIADADGPVDVDGRLTLLPDRSYELSLRVVPGEKAGEGLRGTLKMMGPAAADGSYTFNTSGVLPPAS